MAELHPDKYHTLVTSLPDNAHVISAAVDDPCHLNVSILNLTVNGYCCDKRVMGVATSVRYPRRQKTTRESLVCLFFIELLCKSEFHEENEGELSDGVIHESEGIYVIENVSNEYNYYMHI